MEVNPLSSSSRSLRPLLVTLVTLVLALGSIGSVPAPAQAAGTVDSVTGVDRFVTAANLATQTYPQGARTVFIASGYSPADALAAGPAAALLDAPMLLTLTNSVPYPTQEALRKLRPTQIYIIGGDPVVSPNVQRDLGNNTGAKVDRIGGWSRQDTAAKIAELFFPAAPVAYLVNGWSMPDSMSAAAAAANRRIPLLFATKFDLTSDTTRELSKRRLQNLTAVGSNGVLRDRVLHLGAKLAGDASEGRAGGRNRYETNAILMRQAYVPRDTTGVVVTSGLSDIDGLVASPLGGKGRQLVLSNDTCMTTASKGQLVYAAILDGKPITVVGSRPGDAPWMNECDPPQVSRTCSIAGALAQPLAGEFNGIVSLPDESDPIFSRRMTDTVDSASTQKVVTAVAAYRMLGRDFRFRTYLYPGNQPGTAVLVGGGDPTVKWAWTGYYGGAPSMLNLGDAARARGITRFSIDSNIIQGDPWNPHWATAEQSASMGGVGGLMVNGGRGHSSDLNTPRSTYPDGDAKQAFQEASGAVPDGSVMRAPGAGPIAVIESQPLPVLVDQMLSRSDNMMAEALARQVAIRANVGSSWQSVAYGYASALEGLGFNSSWFHAGDGSGLADDTRFQPRFMDKVLELMDDHGQGYDEIATLLPKSQISGSMARRLGNLPPGSVQAKTGWVDYAYTLAGFMDAPDGSRMRFFMGVPSSYGWVTLAHRDTLDTIVESAFWCGGNLSNG